MDNPMLKSIFSSLVLVSSVAFAFDAPEPLKGQIRFAIIGDLTGGERDGVFKVASKGIEQMQPDFIMSIGDLIEGGTEDEAQMNSEWATFQNNLGNKGIPFYPAVATTIYPMPRCEPGMRRP